MATYPFLSDEWMAEARRIREEHTGRQEVNATVRMNQVITEVPFGTGTVEAHIDTSSGQLEMGVGHLDHADVTVTLDYATARAVFVEGTPQAGMDAFMAGKVKVQGDMAKLIAAIQQQTAPLDPGAADVSRQIKEMTE